MAGETIGEAFMRPFEEGIRSGQSQERIAISEQRANNSNDMQRARLQNMNLMNQMRMMMMQQKLGLMKQGQALKIAQLQQSQNDSNEKIREFNINENDKLKGIGAPKGRSTAEIQNIGAAREILDKYNAWSPTGPDLSKITNSFDLGAYNKLMGASEKGASDAQTRVRYGKGKQLQNTVNQIDPQVLANYTGLEGNARMGADLMIAKNTKHEPEQLKKYKVIVNTLIPAIEGQATGYWGTSITPEEQEKISGMIDASHDWKNNPEDVLEEFNSFSDLVNSELSISSQALTDSDFYSNPQPDSGSINANSSSPNKNTPTKKIVKLMMVNGELQPQ